MRAWLSGASEAAPAARQLGAWMVAGLDAHALFRRLGDAEVAADAAAGLLTSATEEGIKVARNAGQVRRSTRLHCRACRQGAGAGAGEWACSPRAVCPGLPEHGDRRCAPHWATFAAGGAGICPESSWAAADCRPAGREMCVRV